MAVTASGYALGTFNSTFSGVVCVTDSFASLGVASTGLDSSTGISVTGSVAFVSTGLASSFIDSTGADSNLASTSFAGSAGFTSSTLSARGLISSFGVSVDKISTTYATSGLTSAGDSVFGSSIFTSSVLGDSATVIASNISVLIGIGSAVSIEGVSAVSFLEVSTGTLSDLTLSVVSFELAAGCSATISSTLGEAAVTGSSLARSSLVVYFSASFGGSSTFLTSSNGEVTGSDSTFASLTVSSCLGSSLIPYFFYSYPSMHYSNSSSTSDSFISFSTISLYASSSVFDVYAKDFLNSSNSSAYFIVLL